MEILEWDLWIGLFRYFFFNEYIWYFGVGYLDEGRDAFYYFWGFGLVIYYIWVFFFDRVYLDGI